MRDSISNKFLINIFKENFLTFKESNPGGGGYSYVILYGDVPLNRVSFSGFRLQDRVSFL